MELTSYPPSGSQMANLNTLLLWHQQDPPDAAERARNDLIFNNYQHNRNPFIDRPEWVQAIWGTGIPGGGGSQPIAQVTALSSSATESPTMPANLLVSLNQFADGNGVTVSFSMSGSATSADYAITGLGVTFDPATGTGTAQIPANFSSAVITIVPVADGVMEPTEAAVLNIAAGSGYTFVPGASATVSISDTPALPAFWNFNTGAPFPNPLPANSGSGSISFSGWTGSINSFSGVSGLALALSTGGKQFLDRFQFFHAWLYRSGDQLLHPRHVDGFSTGTWSWSIDGTNFTTFPGSIPRRDYNFMLRQVDFSSFTQLNNADSVTLRYTLSGAMNNMGNNRIDDFTITATSTSVRTVQVSASDATASETNSDPGVFLFRINGIANPGGLVIGFAVSGTATPPSLAGADYAFDGAASFDPGSLAGTIIIPEGANAATLRVLPVNDEIFEGAETVIVTIQPQPGYLVGQNASAIVNITERPPNDFFVDATPLPGSTPSATGTNAGASNEPGEPNHANVTGGKSVWWRWTAPATASMRVATTGSNFDTLLAIYTGGAVNALTLIAANNDANSTTQSQVTFSAVAGVTYQIAVDGVGGASGNINLVFSFPPPPPSNDFFADSILLGGNSPSVTGTNISATREAGEPSHGGFSSGHSVWWRWVAPLNGYAVISTAGSNYDTVLAVYTGTAVNALTLIAVNDNANETPQSQVAFAVSAGVTYRIAVDGSSGAEGNFGLAINGSLPLPRASISTTDASAAEGPIDTASFRISLMPPSRIRSRSTSPSAGPRRSGLITSPIRRSMETRPSWSSIHRDAARRYPHAAER